LNPSLPGANRLLDPSSYDPEDGCTGWVQTSLFRDVGAARATAALRVHVIGFWSRWSALN
jgi:hypothetical protein